MRPKNWDNFQHYKDRCPPWIKLHKEILNDRAYMTLPTASKALAPLLWLLASESKDGNFDASIDELEFRLRMSRQELEVGLKALIEKRFFIDDSGVLADCLQSAIPETEAEIEAETKREAKREKSATSVACPPEVDQQVWDDWKQLRKAKKAPVTETVVSKAQAEAQKAGMGLNEFLGIWCARGSQGLEASWLKANERVQGGHFNKQEALEASNNAVVQRMLAKEGLL